MGGLVAGGISCRNPRKNLKRGFQHARKAGVPEDPDPFFTRGMALDEWTSGRDQPQPRLRRGDGQPTGGSKMQQAGGYAREAEMPQTNIPHIWVGQEVSVLAYSGGTKLEELDRRFIQEGETSGMDVKLEEVRGILDDVTDLGIVVTVRGTQRFLTWGGVVGIALSPVGG